MEIELSKEQIKKLLSNEKVEVESGALTTDEAVVLTADLTTDDLDELSAAIDGLTEIEEVEEDEEPIDEEDEEELEDDDEMTEEDVELD